MTGSEGVSFLFPQLFLSQHRLERNKNVIFNSQDILILLIIMWMEETRARERHARLDCDSDAPIVKYGTLISILLFCYKINQDVPSSQADW